MAVESGNPTLYSSGALPVIVHVKNIYRKLDVNNRTQAIARTRELNVL